MGFGIKDLFNINTYTKPIKKVSEQVGLGGVYDALSGAAKGIGENAQYILPFIPGTAFAGLGSLGQFAASPIGRGIIGAGIGTFAGGRPNLKRGLMSGLTSYGLSSGYQGLQDASLKSPTGGFLDELSSAKEGASNLMSDDAVTKLAAKNALRDKFGNLQMGAAYTGISGTAMLDEQEKQIDAELAANRISAAEAASMKARIADARSRAEAAMRANPYNFALGGEVTDQYQLMTPELGGRAPDQRNVFGLAKGGMPPRYIEGPGDGMSDSIPANIDGRQPAKLTDGEFVIPADVVSHLGNGSSKAGAKQLYAMMDRVRKARTGNEKQGKEINPQRLMPA